MALWLIETHLQIGIIQCSITVILWLVCRQWYPINDWEHRWSVCIAHISDNILGTLNIFHRPSRLFREYSEIASVEWVIYNWCLWIGRCRCYCVFTARHYQSLSDILRLVCACDHCVCVYCLERISMVCAVWFELSCIDEFDSSESETIHSSMFGKRWLLSDIRCLEKLFERRRDRAVKYCRSTHWMTLKRLLSSGYNVSKCCWDRLTFSDKNGSAVIHRLFWSLA